jgi:dolichol-phosphate mannosyltransferase
MSEPSKISVVIPVYNEGELIILTLKNIIKSLKNNYEIIICYDFDNDDTLPVIKNNFSKKFIISKIKFIKNNLGGPHAAIMNGIFESIGSYIIVIPADDSVNSQNLHSLVNIAKKGFDIVCPSRFVKGGEMKGAPIIKATINKTINYILKISGLPTADATNGFRLFSKKVVNNIEIRSRSGFTYSIEYLIKAYNNDYKIAEYPSIWIERNKGKSRFKLGKWCIPYLKYFIYGIYVGLKKRICVG